MKRPRILLVTTEQDLTADYVVLALEKKGVDFERLNTDRFPLQDSSSFSVDAGSGLTWSWRTAHRPQADFSRADAVWFRRHRLPFFPDELEQGVKDFCARESLWYLRGAILSLQPTRWMNHPAAVYAAESKLYQLRVAQGVGLRVPPTVVTNDLEQAKVLYRKAAGSLIAKPIRMGFIDHGDRQSAVYTNQVSERDLIDPDELKVSPVIFQELVPKASDIRVTIVGQQVFAASIDSQSVESARVDWRASVIPDLKHERYELPWDLEAKTLELLARLDLTFGAVDLVLTPEGDHIFLEINPNGQWAWLEDQLAFPISESIASWLCGESK